MRQTGILDHWNDERGFGFIRTDEGERIFFHISALVPTAPRPNIGDVLNFAMGKGSDGRPAAVAVRFAGPHAASSLKGRTPKPLLLGWRLYASLLLTCLLALALLLDRAPAWLGIAYGAMGALSFWLYGADKVHARAQAWRTSEFNLLIVDLIFGIIGGLLAQQLFRHKTRKPSYVVSTTLLCVVHALWLSALASGIIDQHDITLVLKSLAL